MEEFKNIDYVGAMTFCCIANEQHIHTHMHAES